MKTWERRDWWTDEFVTTTASGLDWDQVRRRVTFDADTNELLEELFTVMGEPQTEHVYPLPGGTRNTRTVFHYRDSKADICEVYSPPRITEACINKVRPGWALDLTVKRADGRAWDFSDQAMRNEATRMVVQDKPFCLIGSPPCTMFSVLQNGNRHRHGAEAWAAMMAVAQVHVDSCMKLYET